MLCKDGSIIILLFILRWVYREAFGSMSHLLITHLVAGNFLQCINPVISHAVAELLLLSPSNALGQDISKGFTHDFLLNGTAQAHLCLRVCTHGYVKELLV